MKHTAVLLLAITACTHQRKLVDPGDLADEEVTVEVTTAPSVEIAGRVMRGPYGYVVQTYDYGPVEFGQVKHVTQTKPLIGALEGLGLGFLVGATTGGIIGFADGDDVCENEGHCWFTLDAEGKAILGGMMLGAVGGLIGLVVGAARGSRYVYEF